MLWDGYRLIRSLVICWLRLRTNAEKYTAWKINKECELKQMPSEVNVEIIDSVDSQKEARATGFSLASCRRASEPWARFTLRKQELIPLHTFTH